MDIRAMRLSMDVAAADPGAMTEEGKAQRRLGEIRQLSNAIQAMENVRVQIEGDPEFSGLDEDVRQHLATAEQRLVRLIHKL